MKRVLVVLVVMFVVLSSLVWAGGKKESPAPAKTTTTTTEEKKPEPAKSGVVVNEWEIPFLNVLTGPIASIGAYLQWGAEQAAREINAAGGIAGKPVKIGKIDTGMSPETGSVEMGKIVKTALVAMGPVPETVIMASMPIAVENQFMSMTATTSYEYAVKFFPWSISWFPPTEERLATVITGWVEEVGLKGKSAVQFIENYGPWPGMAKAHSLGLTKGGARELNNIDVPQDAVTFGPLVVKALEQKPDALIFACNAEKVAKIIIELKNRGWKNMNNILVFNSADDVPLYATGQANLAGVMLYNYTDPNLNTPRWTRYREAYKAAFTGGDPPPLSTHYYDAVYMIKDAIEKTGVTGDPARLKEERAKIRDYCYNAQNFQGIQFTWNMKEGVPTNKPLFLIELKEDQSAPNKVVKTVRKVVVPKGE
ncbi:MAG: ABC transporter substrate-binding protein [Spirochaetota bacterium]